MIHYIILVVAFFLLAKGADLFVDGSCAIARRCRVSELFVGLTLAAIGTSAPEAAVSIKASIVGSNGIAVGNVLGSNIANICLAIGLVALFTRIQFDTSTKKFEMPAVIVCSLLLIAFFVKIAPFEPALILSRWEGIILLLLLAMYFVYLSRMAILDRRETPISAETCTAPLLPSLLRVIAGLAGIAIGGSFAVDHARAIAELWGVSERVIGISVVALGTSIPEIVTSLVAVIKGKHGVAVGNIVGSNLFNILFVLGMAATIHPIPLSISLLYDAIVCVCIALFFFFMGKSKRGIGRKQGIFLLLCYVLYMIYLFAR